LTALGIANRIAFFCDDRVIISVYQTHFCHFGKDRPLMSEVVNREQVLSALRQIEEPVLKDDLVSLNMIRNLEVGGSRVTFDLTLMTPAHPHRDTIESRARESVSNLPGVEVVDIRMKAEVPRDGRSRPLMDPPARTALAVASGKGGVGKSTIAVNVAVALAESGARVGLLDADIYGPNIPTMMGVSQLPPPRENRLIPAQAHGVKMMSIGFLVKPDQPLIWRGPMLHKAIEQFLSDVAWGELDYLIVDLPPGTGDAGLSIAQTLALTGGVIVTLPQQVSLDDALRGLEMFRQLDVEILGVVENMSYLELPDGSKVDVFGSGGGERLAKQAKVPFIGAIPMDSAVRVGGDAGEPVVLSAPDSPVARALREVAQQVALAVGVSALKEQPGVSINLVG
jgi:ATP-binding protein involved in chromosome partitioning